MRHVCLPQRGKLHSVNPLVRPPLADTLPTRRFTRHAAGKLQTLYLRSLLRNYHCLLRKGTLQGTTLPYVKKEVRMRVFISVEIPEEAKKKFVPVDNLLRNSTLSLKLVNLKNLHLTLKFLGEIREEKLKELIETCQIIGETFSPFSLCLKGVGIFPDIKRPRIIWVGVKKGKENLKKITKLLEEKLEKRGFPAEKREFQGHLTLARVRRAAKGEKFLEDLVEEFKEEEFCSFPVDKFYIMKSEEGPTYTVLEEINLTGRRFSQITADLQE